MHKHYSLKIILITGFLFCSLNCLAQKVSPDGTLSFDEGEVHIEFTKAKDFDEDYRIFGITTYKKDGGPLDYIDALIPMLEVKRYREILATGGKASQCEFQATKEMTVISVIIPDASVRKKVFSYVNQTQGKKFFLHLKGQLLHRKKQTWTWKGHSAETMNTGGLDLTSSLLITEAELASPL